MSVYIEKNTTKTPPPLGEKERKGPRQTPDDDDDDDDDDNDVDVERRATMMMNLKKKIQISRVVNRPKPPKRELYHAPFQNTYQS